MTGVIFALNERVTNGMRWLRQLTGGQTHGRKVVFCVNAALEDIGRCADL